MLSVQLKSVSVTSHGSVSRDQESQAGVENDVQQPSSSHRAAVTFATRGTDSKGADHPNIKTSSGKHVFLPAPT